MQDTLNSRSLLLFVHFCVWLLPAPLPISA